MNSSNVSARLNASQALDHEVNAMIHRAFGAHQEGRWDEAIRGYRRALILVPAQLDALQLIAVLDGQRGMPQEAVPFFIRAVALQPQNTNLRSNFARALCDLLEWNQAIKEYDTLRKMLPYSADILFAWADCQQHQGHFADAMKGYRNVLLIDPSFHPVYATLANAFHGQDNNIEALHQLGMALKLAPDLLAYRLNFALWLSENGHHDQATASVRLSLSQMPNDVTACYVGGMVARIRGDTYRVRQAFRWAILLEPLSVDVRVQWAMALQNSGVYEDALMLAKAALVVNPSNVEALLSLINSLVAHQPNKLQAIAMYLRCTNAMDRSSVEVIAGNALLLHRRGISDRGLILLDLVHQVAPSSAEPYAHRGIILNDLQRYDLALNAFNRALIMSPQLVNPQVNRVQSLAGLDRFEDALNGVARGLGLNPTLVEAYLSQGMVLTALQRMDEALASFSKARDFSKGSSVVYLNRGSCLQKMGEVAQSWADIKSAIVLDPRMAEAYNVMGLLQQEYHSFDGSMRYFERALVLNPDLVDAQLNRGLLNLMLGNLKQGTVGFEWRWRGPLKNAAPNFRQPRWLGEQSLEGKTLLISAEQGFGDAVQYARYYPILAEQAKRLIVEVPSPLMSIFAAMDEGIEWIAQGDPLPEFDLYCPMMSLDLAFKAEIGDIPERMPYLFVPPDAELRWRNLLPEAACKRIGFVWKGNPKHLNDHNRSMPFSVAKEILGLPGFEFHILQQHLQPDERRELGAMNQVKIHADDLKDFSDTAAVLSKLDLLVTVDTSVAHLAGALGVPVWLMLAYVPDYRWMLKREDTPWYPTMRLFRQSRRKDWADLSRRISKALDTEFKSVDGSCYL